MTVFDTRGGTKPGVNRGSHIAGAGHAAVGLARRGTAPAPPQVYNLDSSLTPPPTSSSPAADRQRFFEGPPPVQRRTSCDGFNGRRSVDSMCPPPSRGMDMCTPQSRGMGMTGGMGMDSLQTLEDENRVLREELSRLQSNAIDSLHRRPMAAIAGGGFRGPAQKQQQQCMCDSLRLKLAKIRQELREARGEQRLPSRGGFPTEAVCLKDSEAQTSPKLKPEAVPDYKPPQTAPSTFSGAARMLASAIKLNSHVDANSQTDCKLSANASSQAVSSSSHAEAQTASPPKGEELGVQAGSGISMPADMETQTAAPPQLADTASQVVAVASEEATSQTEAIPTPSVLEATMQTEAIPTPSLAEAETQATAEASAKAMQTDPWPLKVATANASCEASIPSPSTQVAVKLCSAACQTKEAARSVAAVQTQAPPRKAAAATQAGPPPGVDRGTQAEDDSAKLHAKRVAELEDLVKGLQAQVAKLTNQNEALTNESNDNREKAEAFQHMAQTKAFGQMNVTILCPRAECTVSGERIEMDSWNPARLREEFEREVLPRFTRVFVEESMAGMPKNGSKARSEAVDRAMQDFAETFRERLSAMLSAPNAAAAVQAAAAAKGGK